MAKKQFIHNDFALENKTASELYHNYSAHQPIIDFHCHLDPKAIAEDYKYNNLGHMWLGGDHYKWRAMRINGINEKYITGDTTDKEKFMKWAETVPYTVTNPLYHWTQLELARYFNIYDLLSPSTAEKIYHDTEAMLKSSEFSTKNLIKKMNVEMIGTTDDPADSLKYHQKLIDDGFEVKVLPSFRADAVLRTDDSKSFINYVEKLGKVANISISSYAQLISALDNRHAFFHSMGARISDSGPDRFFYAPYTDAEVTSIFIKLMEGKTISSEEKEKYNTAVMAALAHMNHKRGWTQQFHVGALRNNNIRMFNVLGADTGFDSINDPQPAKKMSQFLNLLDSTNQLAQTILYNLNPADNQMLLTMCGNFVDGTSASKVTYGAAWWFLDQKSGMERHLEDLSALSLLSRFVGMVTDSRSFLSYPRHEYFRRIVCNYVGKEVERGLIPDDKEILKNLIEGISYKNAKTYFNL